MLKGRWRFRCTFEAQSFYVAKLEGEFEFGPDPSILSLDSIRFTAPLQLQNMLSDNKPSLAPPN